MKTDFLAATVFILAAVLLGKAPAIASRAAGQSTLKEPPRLPSFEVASIKLNKSSVPAGGYHMFGDRFNATLSVRGLIAMAYGYSSSDRISGGPGWIATKLFDIDAKVDESDWARLSFDQRLDQVRLMVRSLLADRFKLKVTHRTENLSIYMLVLAKSGPKFSEDDSHIDNGGTSGRGPGRLDASSVSLNAFIKTLGIMPDLGGRLVVDKTGLRGNYSFTLHWTPENIPPRVGPLPNSAPLPDASGPSLFTALQEQLGLRLESTKSPVDVVIVDHVEEPTPN